MALFESNVICEYIEDTQAGQSCIRADPLERARASRLDGVRLGCLRRSLGALTTTTDAATFESKRDAIEREICAGRGARLRQGRCSPAEVFSLVDAVFAPVFRYFDVFDEVADLGVFKAHAESCEMAGASSPGGASRSVRAVGADYPELLRAFLERRNCAGILTARKQARVPRDPPTTQRTLASRMSR